MPRRDRRADRPTARSPAPDLCRCKYMCTSSGIGKPPNYRLWGRAREGSKGAEVSADGGTDWRFNHISLREANAEMRDTRLTCGHAWTPVLGRGGWQIGWLRYARGWTRCRCAAVPSGIRNPGVGHVLGQAVPPSAPTVFVLPSLPRRRLLPLSLVRPSDHDFAFGRRLRPPGSSSSSVASWQERRGVESLTSPPPSSSSSFSSLLKWPRLKSHRGSTTNRWELGVGDGNESAIRAMCFHFPQRKGRDRWRGRRRARARAPAEAVVGRGINPFRPDSIHHGRARTSIAS